MYMKQRKLLNCTRGNITHNIYHNNLNTIVLRCRLLLMRLADLRNKSKLHFVAWKTLGHSKMEASLVMPSPHSIHDWLQSLFVFVVPHFSIQAKDKLTSHCTDNNDRWQWTNEIKVTYSMKYMYHISWPSCGVVNRFRGKNLTHFRQACISMNFIGSLQVEW